MTGTRFAILMVCGTLAVILSCAGLNWWSTARGKKLARAEADKDARFVEFRRGRVLVLGLMLELFMMFFPFLLRRPVDVSIPVISDIRRRLQRRFP